MSGWSDPVRIFLIRTYQRKNPDNLKKIPAILRKYEGRRLHLVKSIIKKYKVEKKHISKELKRWMTIVDDSSASSKKRTPEISINQQKRESEQEIKWKTSLHSSLEAEIEEQLNKKPLKGILKKPKRRAGERKKPMFVEEPKKEDIEKDLEDAKEEEGDGDGDEGIPIEQIKMPISITSIEEEEEEVEAKDANDMLALSPMALSPVSQRFNLDGRKRSSSSGFIALDGDKAWSYGTSTSDTPFVAEEILNIDPLTLLQKSTGALASMHSLMNAFEEDYPNELHDVLRRASVAARSPSDIEYLADSDDLEDLIEEEIESCSSVSIPLKADITSIKTRDRSGKPTLHSVTESPGMADCPSEPLPLYDEPENVKNIDTVIQSDTPKEKRQSFRFQPKLTSFESVTHLLEKPGIERRETLKLIKKYENSSDDFAPLIKQEMEDDPTMWLLSWNAQQMLQTPAEVVELLKHLERSISLIEKHIPTCNDLLANDDSATVYFTAVVQELLKRAHSKQLLKKGGQNCHWLGVDFDKISGVVAEDIDRMVRYMAWVRNNIRASCVTDYNDARQACRGAYEIKEALKVILSKHEKFQETGDIGDVDI